MKKVFNLKFKGLVMMLLLSNYAFAQQAAGTVAGMKTSSFVVLIAVILVELVLIIRLLSAISKLRASLGGVSLKEISFFDWKWFDRNFMGAVAIEQEDTVMMDHEYDGIRELDNNLPPWWKYGFYLTIIVAVLYLLNYHVFKTAPLQLQEYNTEMAKAEAMKSTQSKSTGPTIDENNVVQLTDAADIASGKDIFNGNCFSCHGQHGEGGVGPNLTDEYWLHGGGIKNVFKTIKYGVPEKGMISWQQALKPEAIQKVASYILTLQGTKPANAKAPQGEVWKDTEGAPAASAQ